MFARKKYSRYYYGDVQTRTTKLLQRLKNEVYYLPHTQQALNDNVMIIILF